MQVDTLPDDLLETVRDFGLRVAGRIQGERVLILLGEFERSVLGKDGEFARKGTIKISGQRIDDSLTAAPE
jgi:hypothetical protein